MNAHAGMGKQKFKFPLSQCSEQTSVPFNSDLPRFYDFFAGRKHRKVAGVLE